MPFGASLCVIIDLGDDMENTIRISVRNLIEFVMRSGDIDNTFYSNARAVDGIKAHQKVQKSYGPEYHPEYYLKNETVVGGMVFCVEGRADGVWIEEEVVTIDEIKSTTRDLGELNEESNALHWAQAMCYAYFYGIHHRQEQMRIQITYFHLESEERKILRKTMTIEELWHFYESLLQKYLDFSLLLAEHRSKRDRSIEILKFPYPTYRAGQRDLSVATYQTIREHKVLFADAPTGVGKTMSTLFPALKSMPEGHIDKIFYLTARSTTKQICNDALVRLMEGGLCIQSVTITAKDKICINDEVRCNPVDCPYAKGHFDRVNEALMVAIETLNRMDQTEIEQIARQYRVCPFELSLDLATYADVVIGDYNYAFDPLVYLRRFFDSSMLSFVFLVDEAHNLVDRGREMFSKTLSRKSFTDIAMLLSTAADKKLKKSIERIADHLESYQAKFKENKMEAVVEEPIELYGPLKSLQHILEGFLVGEKDHPLYESITELYFVVNAFLKISEEYSESYRTLVWADDEGDLFLKLCCINTGPTFMKILERASATVFFSATLTPMEFYKRLLGGDENSYKIHIASPFQKKNLSLSVLANISTKYRDREYSLADIAEAIHHFINQREGNYFVFFPSYQYLTKVLDVYEASYDEEILVQTPGMTENERAEMLKKFTGDSNRVAFNVLGGVFSEGIDLVGERLIGTVIVSVGLPGLSFERNVIRAFFDEEWGVGFEYAYMYPGMNKVLQAAGRVIRTEQDRGAVLLIDERFSLKRYRDIMPIHWSHIENYYSVDRLKSSLEDFW